MKKIFLLLVLLPVYAWGSAVEQDPAALEWQKQQQQADKRLFKQIKAEVSAGYTDSLSELAALYYFGRGTKKNYKKAYRYFKKAAKHGNEYARYAQAFMLLRGQGVKARPSQALAIQEELAKDDFAPAQVELFYAYRDGTGTAPNQAPATESWLRGPSKNWVAKLPAVLATSTFLHSPKTRRVSPSEKPAASWGRQVISRATSAYRTTGPATSWWKDMIYIR